MKRLFFILTIIFLAGAGCGAQSLIVNDQNNQNSQPPVNANTNTPPVEPEEATNVNEVSEKPEQPTNINTNTNETPPAQPAKFDIQVSFASQAPLGDWNMPYQEACEEASMIMVARYFKNENLNNNIMAEEILKLVKWEEDNGYPIDLTAAQVVEVLDKYFGLKASLDKMVAETEIKEKLVAGNLIIVPLAGRDIGNPYFSQPGPLYHMLVIRGYNQTEFITNDPGTRRGEAYRYKYGDLLWAVHDWVGGVRVYQDPRPEPDIRTGARVMVVVEK
jgi:hypothetical protein